MEIGILLMFRKVQARETINTIYKKVNKLKKSHYFVLGAGVNITVVVTVLAMESRNLDYTFLLFDSWRKKYIPISREVLNGGDAE